MLSLLLLFFLLQARYDALQEKQRELHLESTRQSEEIERLRAALAETDPATTDALKLKALHLEADNERLTAALQQSSADCGDGSAAGRGAVDAGRSESDAVRVLRATVRSHREQLAAAQCAAEEARADAAAARSASSELPDVESGATALIDVDSALAIVCQEQEVQVSRSRVLTLRRADARSVPMGVLTIVELARTLALTFASPPPPLLSLSFFASTRLCRSQH